MKYIKKFENSNKYNIGDYVICIDNNGSYLLKKGNLYKISDVHINQFTKDVFYMLDNISNSSGWSEVRFRAATDEEVSQNKYNL